VEQCRVVSSTSWQVLAGPCMDRQNRAGEVVQLQSVRVRRFLTDTTTAWSRKQPKALAMVVEPILSTGMAG